jgi:anti-anti-sigma factor
MKRFHLGPDHARSDVSDQLEAPISVLDVDGATGIVLSGEIDLVNVDLVERALAAIPAEPSRTVTVDVSQVDFLGLCAIMALVAAAGRLRASGCALQLLHPSPLTQKVLQLLNLDELLPSSESE